MRRISSSKKSVNAADWVRDLRSSAEGRRILERERVWVEATEALCALMDSQGVSSAELARRLDVSRARISQMLSGNRNLTLASLSDGFHALGRSIHFVHGHLEGSQSAPRSRAGRPDTSKRPAGTKLRGTRRPPHRPA
jgi:hypothetical protein